MVDQPLARVRIIDEAIRANARTLVARDPAFIADVSYDGYGHGAVRAARAVVAGGAALLAVVDDEEARLLRDGGITTPVVVGTRCSALELYGLSADRDFAPAMRVSAPVLGTKTIESGDGVSYGYVYRATRRTNLAMVGIGYADGLDRSASNRATLLLDGVARSIAGRVAMNVLMLDLAEDSAELGAEAVIFGPERRAIEWAQLVGRTAAEVAVEFGQKAGASS